MTPSLGVCDADYRNRTTARGESFHNFFADYGPMEQVHHILLLAAGAIVGAMLGALVMWVRARLQIGRAIARASRRSVAQSRCTLKGQIAEQMAPMLPGFAYHPADARFLGDPVDYVIFDGYTSVKDSAANPDSIEIVILDVKRGPGAKLSPSQRAIAQAIRCGRVRFEVLRIDDDGVATLNSTTKTSRHQVIH